MIHKYKLGDYNIVLDVNSSPSSKAEIHSDKSDSSSNPDRTASPARSKPIPTDNAAGRYPNRFSQMLCLAGCRLILIALHLPAMMSADSVCLRQRD